MGMMKRIATDMAEQAQKKIGRWGDDHAFDELMEEMYEIGDAAFVEKYGVASGLMADTKMDDPPKCGECDKPSFVWIHTNEGIRFACQEHAKQ